MSGEQFRVEELNPFMEWHLHTIEGSPEVASEAAREIAQKIGRRTRVLDPEGSVISEIDPPGL